MVSKITAKSPARRRAPHADSSIPASSSAIRRSLRSCRRKLLRIFTNLALLSPSSPQKLGFRRLQPISPAQPPLPPTLSPSNKTLFLDLDETLVHSVTDPAPENYDFVIYPSIDGQIVPFYVLKRPGVDRLLRTAAQRFEVVVFTAGLREYASLVLDLLDPKGDLISHRLYRDSCREIEGKYVKDLSDLGRDLGRVAIVDDNPSSYMLQQANAVQVKPFVNDLEDKELERVMEFFEVAAEFDDIRDAVRAFSGDDRKSSWSCV